MALPIATAERIASQLNTLAPGINAKVVAGEVAGHIEKVQFDGTKLAQLAFFVGSHQLTIKRSGPKVKFLIW